MDEQLDALSGYSLTGLGLGVMAITLELAAPGHGRASAVRSITSIAEVGFEDPARDLALSGLRACVAEIYALIESSIQEVVLTEVSARFVFAGGKVLTLTKTSPLEDNVFRIDCSAEVILVDVPSFAPPQKEP